MYPGNHFRACIRSLILVFFLFTSIASFAKAEAASPVSAYTDNNLSCGSVDTVILYGKTFHCDIDEIDLSDISISNTHDLESALPLFPNLKKVVMCNCGISNEEMDALNNRYEDIRFVWTVKLGTISMRTDATVYAPVIYGFVAAGHDVDNLKYCTDMICIDLGHSWITDISWVRNMPNLQYLVLADSTVTDISALEGHDKLVFLELFLCNIHDVSSLLTCTALEDLNLAHMWMIEDPEDVAQMTWLKRLWWGGCDPSVRDIVNETTMPNTEFCWIDGSSTGYGWRQGQRYYEMRDLMGMHYMYD